ncbi:MAG: ABC transporter permease subunit [Dehalococcoidia bacterium]|nr:ABC transporter permease subunit [Dehalococcoidia bacterium]
MLRNVFLKTLRDRRRALLWWGIGLLGLVLYTLLFYPTVRDSAAELNKLMEEMPAALKAMFVGEMSDFTSPAGYLRAELFSFMVPAVFLIFAIGFGSGAIAAEEERGTLDLLLSNPLSRWRVVVEKFAALVVSTILLAFVLWLGMAVGAAAVGLGIGLGRMAEAAASVALLGLAFGALALAVGCASGNRGMSMSLASALAVAAYLLNSFAPTVEALKPYVKLSPFYYYIGANPLVNGLNPGHVVVLIGLIVVFMATALITFDRRDLAV